MLETYKNKIVTFYKSNKRMPSYSEIMKITGLKSKSPVFKLVSKLVEQGFIRKDTNGKLIPKQSFNSITRLSQTVSAGYGAVVEDEVGEKVDLDDWLVADSSKTFILKVNGDSMKDASILDGDSVLVERTANFKDGQIVVALLNDGYTVKYLRKTRESMYLKPANKKYKPMYPTEDNQIELVAVVKTVIREL